MICGRQYATVSYGYFQGGGTMVVSTPTELPWGWGWAENITFGSADVEINSFYMQTQFKYYGMSLAQRVQYGKQTFPWFHYYLGGNYDHLLQIWRGEREGRQVITFEVPPNTGQLLVVAGNDIELFDYELQSPDGINYDESNCSYNQFDSSLQTVIVIDAPQSGDWDFVTDEEGEIITEFRCLDQQPTTLVSQPEDRGMRNNTVSLSFNDYSDTLSVQVYYDTDNRHFDGVLIQEFELLNNSQLEFEWYNEEIPDGEYFIYTRISDNANAPVLQYAPGSIIVDNVEVEIPQNVNAVQDVDAVNVNWDEAVSDEVYMAKVYYEDAANGFVDVKCVAGENETTLNGLSEGHPYNIYVVFLDGEYNESDASEVVELVYYSQQRNNPPYFLMDDEIVYDFIANEYGEIELIGGDADGNNLSYSVLDNDIGLSISGDMLSWTPLHDDRGVHLMKIVVSDGALADTTSLQLSVLTQEQAAVQLKFNSPNLFEEDNMYVKLKNFRCEDALQSVTLENMVSGESEELELRKVNKFDYIGEFELSFRSRTMLWVANGDTIKAEYEYDGNTYQAFAVYDSLQQYSDDLAPDAITDLEANLNAEDQIVLNWTASGDDGFSGNAYHYDIRYKGEPIVTEDDWLWAQQITCDLYPMEAGEIEEFSFNISELENIAGYDSLFFMIKAEDEMQNWSEMSNNATLRFLLPPANVNAELTDDYCAQLTWTGNDTRRQSRQEVEFLYYNIYWKLDDGVMLPLVSEITTTSYTDTLFWQPDGNYTYAVQCVYNSGNSSRTESNAIELERFTDLRVLCTLSDTTNYEGIEFSLTGLDSVYGQTLTDTTNLFGLLLLADVYKTEYLVEINKSDYRPYSDTLSIDDNNNIYDFELQRLLYGDINLNGEVESFDASLVLQYFCLLEPQGMPLPWAEWLIEKADVDGNGAVEAYDAALILRYVVGLIDEFPAEE
ncbi:MAG: dockerin type I domain-containing protein [Candidatus Stygibacter frigidus]|nr:dockerin type I domain-containing protein [Candidatus Stygibacter frigidus]